jgi:hypothetical protein
MERNGKVHRNKKTNSPEGVRGARSLAPLESAGGGERGARESGGFSPPPTLRPKAEK